MTKQTTQADSTGSPKKGEKKVFPCRECGKVLLSKGGRTLHMRQAHSQGPQCPLCEYMFSTYANLINHARVNHHLNKKKFTQLYSQVKSPKSSKCEESGGQTPSQQSEREFSPELISEKSEKENVAPAEVVSPQVLTFQQEIKERERMAELEDEVQKMVQETLQEIK